MRHNKFLKKEDITINDLIKKYGIVAVLWASTIVIISEFLDDYGSASFIYSLGCSSCGLMSVFRKEFF